MIETYEACPACGGAVHRIAGRCKHCKIDLASWRSSRLPGATGLGAGTAPARADGTPHPSAAAGPAAANHGLVKPQAWVAPPAISPAPSSWHRRWPMVAIGIAIIAIAASLFLLLRDRDKPAARSSATSRSAGHVPEAPTDRFGMPNTMPAPGGPSARDPWQTPPSPGGVPGQAPADPDDYFDDDPFGDPDGLNDLLKDLDALRNNGGIDPNDPWTVPPPGGLTSPPGQAPNLPAGVPPPDQFGSRVGIAACERLSACGLIDRAMQMSCSTIASMMNEPNVNRRLAQGECTYNPTAAATCLRVVESIPCDGQSGDMLDTIQQISGLSDCASALVCVDPWNP